MCQIVPMPVSLEIQCKIRDFNDHLLKCGETNGVSVVKITPVFMIDTGNVDKLCFADEKK